MSSDLRHRMHVNSLLAFFQGQEDLFGKRELAILQVLRERGPMTAREVMIALGFTDMNSVRPRLCELLADEVLTETGDRTDPITGKNVAIFAIREDPRQPQAMFDFARLELAS